MANPEIILTGSVIVTCEHQGKLWVMACERPDKQPVPEPMTSAGTVFTPGYGDKDTRDTALRSLKFLFGELLFNAVAPLKDEMVLCPVERTVPVDPALQNTADARSPRAGTFTGTNDRIQVAHDYVLHMGKVEKLPELDAHPKQREREPGMQHVWLDVSAIELKQMPDRTFYVLTEAQGPYQASQEAFPSGGMFAVEYALQHARGLEFKNKGYDGLKGFMQREQGRLAFPSEKYPAAVALDDAQTPVTELGKGAADYYRMARVALLAIGDPQQGKFTSRV